MIDLALNISQVSCRVNMTGIYGTFPQIKGLGTQSWERKKEAEKAKGGID